MQTFRFMALLAVIGVVSAVNVHTTEDGTGHSDDGIGFAGVAPSSSTVSNAVASASPTAAHVTTSTAARSAAALAASPTAALVASPKASQKKQLTTSSTQGMFVTGFGVAVVAAFM